MNIVAWVSFALSLIVNMSFAIVGAIVGFFYQRETGKKASFYANLAVLALWVVFLIMIGLVFI